MATNTDTPKTIVTMICPNLTCRRPVQAPESARGQSVRCTHCNSVFLVPRKKQQS